MRLKRHPRRRQPETVIALVDVTFFLLVFFLLVARLDATTPFRVEPPVGTSGADMPGGGVTLAIAADGALAIDGTATPRDTAAARLRALATPERMLRVNADRTAPLQFVLPLVAEMETAGYHSVVLVITPGPP